MKTKKTLLENYIGRISEAQKDDNGNLRYPVVIISQGLGNLADRNYYTKDAVISGVAVYEGKKAYFDHPTATQSQEQPGRSVRETAGHYEDVKAELDKEGLMVLKAFLVPETGNTSAINKIEHAIKYKKKYPDKDYIGISINGDGEGSELEYDEFLETYKPQATEMEKIAQIKGQSINAITKLTDAVSADLVTEAGAKGRILLESQKLKRSGNFMKFAEAFKKFFQGLESNDPKLREDAVKSMLQAEGDEEDEAAKKEAAEAADMAEAEGMAKALLNAKKEMKQEEGESTEAYEAKCMKQAMQNFKKEQAEAAAKKEGESEGKKSEDESDKSKGEGEKKSDEGDKGADSDKKDGEKGHADADQDKELIKKMMGEMESMKKEMEAMKSELGKKHESEKQHHAESAKAKIILAEKERNDLIDSLLEASALPRRVTKELRPLIEKCKNKEEMEALVKKMKEAFHKAVEENFFVESNRGFTEIEPTDKSGSNDHLF